LELRQNPSAIGVRWAARWKASICEEGGERQIWRGARAAEATSPEVSTNEEAEVGENPGEEAGMWRRKMKEACGWKCARLYIHVDRSGSQTLVHNWKI